MKLLLDTHIFLWYINGDPQLPATFIAAIRNRSNTAFLSAASVWEVVIKHSLGKLPCPPRQPAFCHSKEMPTVSRRWWLTREQWRILRNLHRDPFDRLLIAQAAQHDLTLVSVDSQIKAFQVSMLPEA